MAVLSPLSSADIPEVMRLERLPGYETFIGQFTAEEHAAEFASADSRYFGVRADERLAGFVIFQELSAPVVLLRRIAVAEPGGGLGTAMLREAMDWVFQETPAEGLKLDVVRDNPRARRVYEREGFEHYDVDETHYFLSISRTRWEMLRGRGG
jgi:Acetyltransferases, including N-acetylases of ribosomal proteins